MLVTYFKTFLETIENTCLNNEFHEEKQLFAFVTLENILYFLELHGWRKRYKQQKPWVYAKTDIKLLTANPQK